MRKQFVLAAFTALCLLMGSTFAGEKARTIGLCMSSLDTFLSSMAQAAIDRAAEIPNLELIMVDAQDDTVKQNDQVVTLLEAGIDVLVVCLVETSAAPNIIAEAAKKDTPVIFVNRNPFFTWKDTPIPPNNYVVASNSLREGAVGMEYVGEKLGGKGNIVILMGMLGQEATTNRTQGVKDAIRDKYPNIKILSEETGNWYRDQGMTVMENLITAYGDQINAVLSNNDEMAIGAVLALEQNNMKDKVLVVGVDGTRDGLESVKTGGIAATAYQDPIAQGAGSVNLALRIIAGEKPDTFALLPVEVVTKENIAKFEK